MEENEKGLQLVPNLVYHANKAKLPSITTHLYRHISTFESQICRYSHQWWP